MSANMNILGHVLGSQPDISASLGSGFNKLLSRIRATPSESAAAASHRNSIKLALETAFGMTAFFRTGSFGNGTNISGHSDVDYFAVIPTSNLKQNSDSTLDEVSSVLRERFPLTGVRVDAPGIHLPFGSDAAESTEIVPVDATGLTKLGFRQFDMPDGNGGWMFAAPESHKAYVDLVDSAHSGMVKPLIRFLKAWNFKRNVGIKSFYLELWVAKYAFEEKSILYDVDILSLFQQLWVNQLADLPDPRFPQDGFTIKPCKTELQRAEALKKLWISYQWSMEAFEYRKLNKAADAFDRWDLVFNHDFPAFER